MTLQKTRLDYKWVILILCFFMEFICLGFCSSNVGLYTKAVTEALDGLPAHKIHCSVLAEEAIHSALEDYYSRQKSEA